MIVFLGGLALIAPVIILFVDPTHDYNPVTFHLQDLVVLPRLAATAAFTGGALLWGAVLIARDRWPARRWPVAIWASIIAFGVANLLALLFAEDWRASMFGENLRYQGLATTLVYLLLFAVAAVAVRSLRDLRLLLWGVCAGALVTAVYALVQKAGLDWIGWQGVSTERPFSTMGQANTFGAYLVAVISASAFLAAGARQRWLQALLGFGLLVMLAALFVTVSRSAYVGLGVVTSIWGLAGALWFLRERPVALRVAAGGFAAVPLAVFVIAIFFIGLPQGRVAVTGEENSQAVDGRLSLWRLGLEMTADRPLFGYGQDGFSIQFPKYRDEPDLPGILTESLDPESAHNFVIDLLSGTGVLGFLTFVAVVGSVLWLGYRRALATGDASFRMALVALGAGVTGYLAAVFFGFMEAITSWAFWLLLGAMAGLLAKTPATTPVAPEAARTETGEAPHRKTRRKKRQERQERRALREQAPVLVMPQASLIVAGLAALVLSLLGAACLAWSATVVAADLASEQAEDARARGDIAGADRLASRAASLNPLRREYHRQRAEIALSAGSPDAAIAEFEMILDRFEPGAFETLGLANAVLAKARQESRLLSDVAPFLERAVALDPYNGQLRLTVANIYEQIELPGKALEHRLTALCWEPHPC